MPNKHMKYSLAAAVLSALTLLSACDGSSLPDAVKTTESVPITETSVPDIVTEPVGDTSVTDTSEVTVISSSSSRTTTPPVSSDTSDSESDTSAPEADDTEPAEENSVSETTAVSAEEETSPSSAELPAVSVTSETTTTAAPPPVKHDPSPPVIKKVSSDGVDVFTCKKGTIDYSNADKGYISAIYTGDRQIAKLRITSGGRNYDYTLYPDGKYHYYTLSLGSGDYTVQMFEQFKGNGYSDVVEGSFTAKIPNDVDQYTYTNDYIYFDEGSKCVALASELCGGCDSDLEKVAAVFSYIVENISYDYDLAASIKTWYIPDPDETLKKKTGVCFDYASLMAAMLRSQGIPTRMLFGYVYIAPDNQYHAWNEVYTKETGWVTLEVLFRSAGYNLLDSTLYSTADNKKWVADLMSDNNNYTKTYIY